MCILFQTHLKEIIVLLMGALSVFVIGKVQELFLSWANRGRECDFISGSSNIEL